MGEIFPTIELDVEKMRDLVGRIEQSHACFADLIPDTFSDFIPAALEAAAELKRLAEMFDALEQQAAAAVPLRGDCQCSFCVQRRALQAIANKRAH